MDGALFIVTISLFLFDRQNKNGGELSVEAIIGTVAGAATVIGKIIAACVLLSDVASDIDSINFSRLLGGPRA